MQVCSPVNGTSREVGEIPDPVFSSGMVGPGLAIDPEPGTQHAVAPIDGTLAKLHPHAFLVIGDDGAGVLVHLGIDTVHMRGDGFTVLAAERDRVTTGQDIVAWDPAYVAGTGRSPICAVVVPDCKAAAVPLQPSGSAVTAAQPVFDITC
jgi:sugar PTS system EIIA component